MIATATVSRVTVRKSPGGKQIHAIPNPVSGGTPLTFMVTESRPGWLRVALPMRPNGSSGWITRDSVELTRTPYRLIVSLSHHTLDVMNGGRRLARHRVGVGKAATPTPAGVYYLTELVQPHDPQGAYGPYAFGLSAYSDTLETFAGGPGQLGLHGTDQPEKLGRDVSHGCLRVANDVIRSLAADLPLGTPVEITV